MRSTRATVRLAGALVGTLAVLAAGCSSSGPDTHSSPAARVTPTDTPANAPVKIRTVRGTGTILTNSRGMALYANNVETSTATIKCVGECAAEWPPLMVSRPVPKELAGIKEKCPIERLRRYLQSCGVSESELEAIGEEASQEVIQAVERARAAPRPDPATAMEYVYSAPSLGATRG